MNVKNIFKKENLMPVAVLAIICLVIAGLLAAVNMITGPIIKKAEEQKVYDSLREVLDGDFEPAEIPEGTDESVTAIYNVTEDGDPVGKVVTVSAKGYASTILLTVGVDTNGTVTKAVVTSQAETHGKAGMSTYTDSFSGVSSDALADVELFSGATISSTAIKNAIITAVAAASGEVPETPEAPEEETLPKTDAELEALAATLLGTTADTLVNVTPENTELVKRVYKNASGTDYAVYVVVISASYGTVESETLIHVGANGAVKGVNKLVWKTSDAIYGYVPPSEDEVNAFYDRLVGLNSTTAPEVELVTNATNTSTNVRSSVVEAISVVNELVKKDMPTPENEVMDLAAQLMGVSADALEDVTTPNSGTVRRVYRDRGGNGFAVYTVVISANYGTVESETLIHVGADGVIRNVKKMIWKTSDAIYGYVPPSEDEVNAFYGRLVGLNSDTLAEVELVTNATNTSTNLRNALAEALEAVNAINAPEVELSLLPRTVGIIALVLAVLAIGAYVALPEIIRRRKRA